MDLSYNLVVGTSHMVVSYKSLLMFYHRQLAFPLVIICWIHHMLYERGSVIRVVSYNFLPFDSFGVVGKLNWGSSLTFDS